eukprot:12886943-Prorocentrum_lima.AAC.1
MHRLSGDKKPLPGETKIAVQDVGTKWALEDNHDPREASLVGRLSGSTTTIRLVENLWNNMLPATKIIKVLDRNKEAISIIDDHTQF